MGIAGGIGLWPTIRKAEKKSEKGIDRPLARVIDPLFGLDAHNHLLTYME